MNQAEQIKHLKGALVYVRQELLQKIWRIRHRTLAKYPTAVWFHAELDAALSSMLAAESVLPAKLRAEIRKEAAYHFRQWHAWLMKHEARGERKEAA